LCERIRVKDRARAMERVCRRQGIPGVTILVRKRGPSWSCVVGMLIRIVARRSGIWSSFSLSFPLDLYLVLDFPSLILTNLIGRMLLLTLLHNTLLSCIFRVYIYIYRSLCCMVSSRFFIHGFTRTHAPHHPVNRTTHTL